MKEKPQSLSLSLGLVLQGVCVKPCLFLHIMPLIHGIIWQIPGHLPGGSHELERPWVQNLLNTRQKKIVSQQISKTFNMEDFLPPVLHWETSCLSAPAPLADIGHWGVCWLTHKLSSPNGLQDWVYSLL